jgi:hypothetical protein
VQVGSVSGPRLEILNGLDDGDRVITSGAQNLTDGMLVRVSTERK